MTPEIFHSNIMPAAFGFMHQPMDTPAARAMLLAIGMQESDFEARNQRGGPANGYFQFELIGVRGALLHHRTGATVRHVAKIFDYDKAGQMHLAIEDNDLLATIFARYTLYNYPGPLPGPKDVDEAWRQYLSRWRPGKPRKQRWKGRYAKAWAIVNGTL